MPTQSINLSQLQQQITLHLEQTRSIHNPVELLAHGEANVIFRLGDQQLIRVAVNTPNQRFEGDIRRVTKFEKSILEYLNGTEIGHQFIAAQLERSHDFSYTYLITSYLPGISLDYSRSHLQKCAETLAKLHSLPFQKHYSIDRLKDAVPTIQNPLTLFYQEARQYAQPYLDSAGADPEVVSMIEAVLKAAEKNLWREEWLREFPYVCLVHSDHTYENWVVNDRQAHLIDWEWAELGSPAGDLGHFLSPVTIIRRHSYRLPEADRAFFLQCYYDMLENRELADRIARHFAAFGAYPAVRSLCWTAGYWITANRWYANSEESPSARERMRRLEQSRQQFPELWQDVMRWLEETGAD